MQYSRRVDSANYICDDETKSKSLPSASNCSETPDIHFESRCSSYTDSMGTCSACLILAPHSQMFVCLKSNCGYSLQQKVPILSPSLFYRREKVFCGACAFRGLHSAHKKYMKEAEPLAFKTASTEVGTKLEIDFDKLAKLSEDNPIDYFMIEAMGGKTLKKIPVIEYLSKSGSIMEWHRRLALLNNTLQALNEYRIQGHLLVKGEAEKLLTAYSKTSKSIQKESAVQHPEKMGLDEIRRIEHHRIMGLLPSNDSDFSSLSSSSRKSSIRSVSTTSTVLQIPPYSLKNQAKALHDADNEVTGGFSAVTKEKTSEPKFVEESVTNTNIVMSRRFDAIRRNETIEDTVAIIADALDARIKCVEHKKAVVQFMEKAYSIEWPRNTQ